MHAYLLQKLRGTYYAHFQIYYISVFFSTLLEWLCMIHGSK